MPYLDQIITNVNDAIVGKLQSADINISLHGVSIRLPRTSNDPAMADGFPVFVDQTGDGSFNAVDDRFAMCIYHRCLSLTFASETQLDFGDGQDFQRETSQMAVFIWGDRRKLKMTQESVIALVAASLPSSLPQSFVAGIPGFNSGFFSPATSPNDSQAAWRQEFDNIEYTLPPEQFFVQLNYTIETIIQKSCIEICAEC